MDSDRSELLAPRPVPTRVATARQTAANMVVAPSASPVLADTDTAPHRTAPPRRHRSLWSWHSRLVTTTVVVVLVALATTAVVVGWRAHTGLRHTTTSVVAEQARLHQTLGSLAEARSSLAAVSSQSSVAAASLAADERQLASVQSQLAKAQANEVSQGINIADLDQCLAGVEQALNQVSLGNPAGAATTLHGVATECRSAEPG